MKNEEYLGDAVYAQIREADGVVVLTTGAHFDTLRFDECIYLEAEVQQTLLRYLLKIRKPSSSK
jgi:hypothetical protein